MNVGIVAQKQNRRAASLAEEMRERLREEDAEVTLDAATAEALGIERETASSFADCDLVVSIGGDGKVEGGRSGASDSRSPASDPRPGVPDIWPDAGGREPDDNGRESDAEGRESDTKSREVAAEGRESDAGGRTPIPDDGDTDREPGAGSRDGEKPSSPFDEDFATALRNAPGLSASERGASGASGDASDGAGRFGGGGDFGGGNERGDSFGSSPETFDDEEFESDIARTKIGIEGLDDMILGGVPKRSLMVAVGSAGTGKTTFGLQFLQHALADGKSGVFITLEETRERIIDTAEEKGWPLREYEREERLAVIDLDPVEMANSLTSIRNDLPRLIDEFGADRLVLDSVSLLEMMYDHPARRRSEVFNFSRSLKEAGVTTMLTSEASGDNAYQSRYGIVEYLADAVFVLQYVRPSDFQETRLAIEIQKIRDANHSRETKPYEITDDGISVYRRANIF